MLTKYSFRFWIFEYSMFNQFQSTTWNFFFTGLENQFDCSFEIFFFLFKNLSCTKKHSNMKIMSASMHHTRPARRIIRAGFFEKENYLAAFLRNRALLLQQVLHQEGHASQHPEARVGFPPQALARLAAERIEGNATEGETNA